MFSSNPSLYDLEKDCVYFNPHEHNINPFGSTGCFFHAFAPSSTPVIASNSQDFARQQLHEGSRLQYCENYNELLESVVYPCKKKMATSKKDGHSKIYTAQGPRDRRVRLSIDIARKFFVLQELLGLDKASKTLDWLFTKSKTAIKELVEETKNSSSSSTVSTDQCELAFLEAINEDKVQNKPALKFLDAKKKRLMRQKYKSGFLARDQSRAEARARARERTKEKLRIKELGNSNLTLQSSFWGQIEFQTDYNEIMMQQWSSMLYTYHQNLVLSDESSSQIPSKGLPKVHEEQGNHAMII